MIRIGQSLHNEDLNNLKYLCSDVVAESALDSVKTPTALFTLLQHGGHLREGSYEFVRKSLVSIGRNDLAMLLPSLQEDTPSSASDDHLCPARFCQLKHRMMLVSVANRMRREDVFKLAFINNGKVEKNEENDTVVVALKVFAELEGSRLLSCGDYSLLCDMFRLIGRIDLAEFVTGFPTNVPTSFTTKGQAFMLMMEVMGKRKTTYVLHQKKLLALKEGCLETMGTIHSGLQSVCVQGLSSNSTENTISSVEYLQTAFDSQLKFLECILLSTENLKMKEQFNFVNDAFGCDDDKVIEEYPCPVAESAHQIRRFVLEAACEVIGKEKVTLVYQLNNRIERGINICSGYGKHVLSLLSSLTSLLTSGSQKQPGIRHCAKQLAEIITLNRNFILATLPSLTPFIHAENLDALSSLFETDATRTTEVQFYGAIAMVVIPSFALLLNLWYILNNCEAINVEDLLKKLIGYVSLDRHIAESKKFIQKCAATMLEEISCFVQQVIELDDLCAPLISELVTHPGLHH